MEVLGIFFIFAGKITLGNNLSMILLLIMIMNDIRKLIYEEKSSLNAFDVKKHSSLNKRIYDLWLIKRKEQEKLPVIIAILENLCHIGFD